MKKLSKADSPMLAAVIKEKDALSAIFEIKKAEENGADLIDLHLSCLEKADIPTLKSIMAETDLPVLSLNYSYKKGDINEKQTDIFYGCA